MCRVTAPSGRWWVAAATRCAEAPCACAYVHVFECGQWVGVWRDGALGFLEKCPAARNVFQFSHVFKSGVCACVAVRRSWSPTMQLGTHCCMLQVYLAVYKSFMEAIDAIDNGEAVQEAGREGGRE